MSPSGFEHAILASERPQTHALDRAATGIGYFKLIFKKSELIVQSLELVERD